MSRRKTERLLSLVVCLLSARRYLTAAQIREAVPGYPDSFEAFKRMFERDKDELRELGIPLETGTNSPERRGARLPDLPAGLRAARDPAGAGRGGGPRAGRPGVAPGRAGGAAEGALLKLRAAGIEAEDTDPAGHRAAGADPRGGVRAAVGGGPGPAAGDVRLPRPPAGSAPQQRRLEPWGVVNRRGRWYVAGRDTDRGEQRVFRLSRIAGPVTFTGPAGRGHRAARHRRPRRGPRPGTPTAAAQRTCLLRVRAGAGHGLRRHARQPGRTRRAGLGPGRGALTPTPAGGASTWPRSAPTWWCWSRPTCAMP